MRYIDIVLPLVASRYENFDLRIALRSIQRYATGVAKIFVVGDDPGFLAGDTEHVPCPMFPGHPKDARIALQLLWCFDRIEVTDPVCLWNDDFVLNDGLYLPKLRTYQKGERLVDAAGRHRSHTYKSVLMATSQALDRRQATAWHYDIHCPILYSPAYFRELWPLWVESARSKTGYVVKSIYGNLCCDPETDPVLKDLKLLRFPGREALEEQIKERWIYSYNNGALRTGLRDYLEELYPEKSRYEK